MWRRNQTRIPFRQGEKEFKEGRGNGVLVGFETSTSEFPERLTGVARVGGRDCSYTVTDAVLRDDGCGGGVGVRVTRRKEVCFGRGV